MCGIIVEGEPVLLSFWIRVGDGIQDGSPSTDCFDARDRAGIDVTFPNVKDDDVFRELEIAICVFRGRGLPYPE